MTTTRKRTRSRKPPPPKAPEEKEIARLQARIALLERAERDRDTEIKVACEFRDEHVKLANHAAALSTENAGLAESLRTALTLLVAVRTNEAAHLSAIARRVSVGGGHASPTGRYVWQDGWKRARSADGD